MIYGLDNSILLSWIIRFAKLGHELMCSMLRSISSNLKLWKYFCWFLMYRYNSLNFLNVKKLMVNLQATMIKNCSIIIILNVFHSLGLWAESEEKIKMTIHTHKGGCSQRVSRLILKVAILFVWVCYITKSDILWSEIFVWVCY